MPFRAPQQAALPKSQIPPVECLILALEVCEKAIRWADDRGKYQRALHVAPMLRLSPKQGKGQD